MYGGLFARLCPDARWYTSFTLLLKLALVAARSDSLPPAVEPGCYQFCAGG